MNLKKILNHFKKNRRAINTPLEKLNWNDVVKECFDKGLDFIYPVIKIIYTDDKAERAVLLEKSNSRFTIAYEKLYPFNDDELNRLGSGLHGYWSPNNCSMVSVFNKKEDAINAIFSEPPFKYNKCIVWADTPFRIDSDNLYWISNNGMDDPNDLCLHGHVVVKIGEEIFDYDPTVSAAGLYLLRTLTDNHIMHDGEAMLPCCGHWMIASSDLSSVDIGGCPNGIDWSVMHEDGKIKLITKTGKETLINIDNYREEVYAFADKIEGFYKQSSPKNLSEADSMSRDGYIAFWNEWHRRRKRA